MTVPTLPKLGALSSDVGRSLSEKKFRFDPTESGIIGGNAQKSYRKAFFEANHQGRRAEGLAYSAICCRVPLYNDSFVGIQV